MVCYADEEEYYQENPDRHEEYGMEQRPLEALGTHVQDSVNQALIKTLKPFTRPLVQYGQCELRGKRPMVNMPRDDLAPNVGLAQTASVGPSSSAEILVQMAASVLKDYEYDPFSSLEKVFP
ncbi:hypothetical protein NDU88_005634 [Pleurodeles waltl]|uniref:Uncharacterized protein n=1 Tax=Pleurodeles waltl TaxID=8319 RepID=A0AAV7NPJ6_PLEWA|nr:hypothetical protein NDU88_005634 [Pleurodeles waltl]